VVFKRQDNQIFQPYNSHGFAGFLTNEGKSMLLEIVV
jgi:hypothetical protein